MPFGMYKASVPAFAKSLRILSTLLDKAEAFAVERKIEPDVLLNWRLAPDMFPLRRQVQLASDFAKGAAARLADAEVPKYADEETTFAELKARIAKTVTFVEGFAPGDFDGAEQRDIEIPVRTETLHFKGEPYLVHFALPNFYFHVTTAYVILRRCGVEIGKRDFLGAA